MRNLNAKPAFPSEYCEKSELSRHDRDKDVARRSGAMSRDDDRRLILVRSNGASRILLTGIFLIRFQMSPPLNTTEIITLLDLLESPSTFQEISKKFRQKFPDADFHFKVSFRLAFKFLAASYLMPGCPERTESILDADP